MEDIQATIILALVILVEIGLIVFMVIKKIKKSEGKDKNPEYFIGQDKGYYGEHNVYIQCVKCGMKSYHPEDIKHRWCEKCQKFHKEV